MRGLGNALAKVSKSSTLLFETRFLFLGRPLDELHTPPELRFCPREVTP
jgi:hypothetical protein